MSEVIDNAIRQDIIRISREVFKRHGLAKVSMDDISKSCGKSRSSLYHYFKNKKDVFESFAIEEFSNLINEAGNKLKSSDSIKVNLYVYNSVKLKKIKQLTKEYYNIIEDFRDEPEIFNRITKISLKEEKEIITKILRWGIENKDISGLNENDVHFLSYVIVSAFRSFEWELILHNKLNDMETRMKWLIDILYKGLK